MSILKFSEARLSRVRACLSRVWACLSRVRKSYKVNFVDTVERKDDLKTIAVGISDRCYIHKSSLFEQRWFLGKIDNIIRHIMNNNKLLTVMITGKVNLFSAINRFIID